MQATSYITTTITLWLFPAQYGWAGNRKDQTSVFFTGGSLLL